MYSYVPSSYSAALSPFIAIPLTLIKLLLSAFVFLISLTHIGGELFKWYTINLYISCLPSDIVFLITTIYHFITNNQQLSWLEITNNYLLCLNVYQYMIMSMFVIVVTNVLFLKPLLFERIFPERYWILYFALLHFLSNLMVFPYLYTMLSNGTVGSMESINVLYFIRSIATVIIVTISAVITIVAIASIVDYHPIGCDSRTMEENRKRLTCFIVYCIPCEILNLPTFALAVCNIVSAVMDQRFYLSSRLLLFDNYVAEVRTFVFSLCTLYALPSYRNAVSKIFHLRNMKQRFLKAKVATQSSSQMRDVTVIPIVNGHSSSRDRSEVVKTICQNQNV